MIRITIAVILLWFRKDKEKSIINKGKNYCFNKLIFMIKVILNDYMIY